MSYESPIEVILGQMQTKYENGILEAVQNCGFQIDHDELAKALMDDRQEYEKGYKDRDSEIIRCKDCKHYSKFIVTLSKTGQAVWDEYCEKFRRSVTADDFCSRAERREKE